ncbi:hypothetical protein BASA82_000232 [Batrachochytrium salamandrivorans]|nr:hypothetical protein BASA82_000232 [Batrachochytrium salamandrivorans]
MKRKSSKPNRQQQRCIGLVSGAVAAAGLVGTMEIGPRLPKSNSISSLCEPIPNTDTKSWPSPTKRDFELDPVRVRVPQQSTPPGCESVPCLECQFDSTCDSELTLWTMENVLPKPKHQARSILATTGLKSDVSLFTSSRSHLKNSERVDYVTEKLYGPLAVGSVPVYLGAHNVKFFAPDTTPYPYESQAMISTRDFSDDAAVIAQVLTHLANTPELYAQLLAWKRRGLSDDFKALASLSNTHSSCRACVYAGRRKFLFTVLHMFAKIQLSSGEHWFVSSGADGGLVFTDGPRCGPLPMGTAIAPTLKRRGRLLFSLENSNTVLVIKSTLGAGMKRASEVTLTPVADPHQRQQMVCAVMDGAAREQIKRDEEIAKLEQQRAEMQGSQSPVPPSSRQGQVEPKPATQKPKEEEEEGSASAKRATYREEGGGGLADITPQNEPSNVKEEEVLPAGWIKTTSRSQPVMFVLVPVRAMVIVPVPRVPHVEQTATILPKPVKEPKVCVKHKNLGHDLVLPRNFGRVEGAKVLLGVPALSVHRSGQPSLHQYATKHLTVAVVVAYRVRHVYPSFPHQLMTSLTPASASASPEQVLTLDEAWDKIQPELDKLFGFMDGGLDNLPTTVFTLREHAVAYSVVYKFCLCQSDPEASNVSTSARLYERYEHTIRQYLKTRMLTVIQNKHGLALLQEFSQRYKLFTTLSRWFVKFFNYLDRFHVQFQGVLGLQACALKCFQEEVFDPVKANVTREILLLVERERMEGDSSVDKLLLRECLDVYRAMERERLSVYEEDFECHLLQQSRQYYQIQAESWIAANSTPQYLTFTEAAINSEVRRVNDYLFPSTERKVKDLIAITCLQQQQTQLLGNETSGIKVLLQQDRSEDLGRLFRLFVMLDGGLEPVSRLVEEHIRQEGSVILDKRAQDVQEEAPSTDSQFIQSLLKLHDKYQTLVSVEFQMNNMMQKALKQAFETTMNTDLGKQTNAELMATYADTKRLLNQRSASPFAEKSMIQKLKLKCGHHFTSKLEGMLTDLSLGQDIQVKFQQHLLAATPGDSALGMEFGCEVLTTGHWPSYKLLELAVPQVMQRCMDVYTTFYNTQTKHRKLTWVHSLGRATVKGQFKQTYDFEVTTLQAIVLLLFNQQGQGQQLSLQQITDQLQLREHVEVVKKTLHSLACNKSKIRKIKLPAASLEENVSTQRIEEDRSMAIEACIVRVMKARKRLQHNLLITEVTNQLRQFKPNPKMIKKKIEHLIERDYLARDETEVNFYNYLA